MKIKDRVLRKIFSKEIQRFEESSLKLNDNERVIHAQAMLTNPIFNEAFNDIELELLRMWKASSALDKEGREVIYYNFQVLEKLKLKFQTYANKVKIDEIIKLQEKEFMELVV